MDIGPPTGASRKTAKLLYIDNTVVTFCQSESQILQFIFLQFAAPQLGGIETGVSLTPNDKPC